MKYEKEEGCQERKMTKLDMEKGHKYLFCMAPNVYLTYSYKLYLNLEYSIIMGIRMEFKELVFSTLLILSSKS